MGANRRIATGDSKEDVNLENFVIKKADKFKLKETTSNNNRGRKRNKNLKGTDACIHEEFPKEIMASSKDRWEEVQELKKLYFKRLLINKLNIVSIHTKHDKPLILNCRGVSPVPI